VRSNIARLVNRYLWDICKPANPQPSIAWLHQALCNMGCWTQRYTLFLSPLNFLTKSVHHNKEYYLPSP
jgi:hypothetical protein